MDKNNPNTLEIPKEMLEKKSSIDFFMEFMYSFGMVDCIGNPENSVWLDGESTSSIIIMKSRVIPPSNYYPLSREKYTLFGDKITTINCPVNLTKDLIHV